MPPKFTIIIPLTKGQSTRVDPIDGDLAKLKWCTRGYKSRYYAARCIWNYELKKCNMVDLHRIIMAKVLGRELITSEKVDHIDNNSLNNKRSNLRLATNSQNMQNQKAHSDSKCKLKGVAYCSTKKDAKKWKAAIKVNGKTKNLGYFLTPEEAHSRYREAAIEYYGEFARFE